MRVFVVFREIDYEGCSEPEAVFSSEELVKAFIEEQPNRYFTWVDLQVDALAPKAKCQSLPEIACKEK